MLGQAVLNPRRYFGVDRARDDTVAFQLTQLLGQHLLGDTRYQPLELGKAPRLRHQVIDQQRLPLATDHRQGDFHRRVVDLFSRHKQVSPGR
ncbi:hypothetical protein D3C84_1108980 [compost metagenome]